MDFLIAQARKQYHKDLLDSILTIDKDNIPSNADRSSKISISIAKGITDILLASVQEKALGQTSGKKFEECNMTFLQNTFPYLQHIRPGKWKIIKLGNNNKLKTSDFAQYEHLCYLNELTKTNSQLAAALGNDYMVSPDVIVYRELYNDDEINSPQPIINNNLAKSADLRKVMEESLFYMPQYQQSGLYEQIEHRIVEQKH